MRSLSQLVFTFPSFAAITEGNQILFYSEERCDSSFGGCQNNGASTCCYSNTGGKAVRISKGPLDVAIGWY